MNVEDAGKDCPWMRSYVFGMHAANTTAAENGDFQHQDPPNSIFAMIVA
jgi:hypothetical protein